MRYLNLGCGHHYSILKEWTNVDFASTGNGVIAHNLLKGIPFENSSFDLVYHSHVLEHFTKKDGEEFISECFRVLKPGGIMRIALPDLECIVKNYLKYMHAGLENPEDDMIRANYEWMLLEMYDQTVRDKRGGSMASYIFQNSIKNEDFVFKRIGDEGRSLKNFYLQSNALNSNPVQSKQQPVSKFEVVKRNIKKYLLKKLHVSEQALSIGKFRMSGEIHQWMYDRFSLLTLLTKMGGSNIQIRNAQTSFLTNWEGYQLDSQNGVVRKPDSLFIEAIKHLQ